MCRLNFSCAILPMVSSPFASPWGVGNFGAFCLDCVELFPLCKGNEIFLSQVIVLWLLFGFWSLVWVFGLFLFLFSKLFTLCCQCTYQVGDWGLVHPMINWWSLLGVISDWQRSVDLKDISSDQTWGSECEPIKILLEGDGISNKTNTASKTRLRLTTQFGQDHVATGVLLVLGTNNHLHLL
jgi:hypothetical protein